MAGEDQPIDAPETYASDNPTVQMAPIDVDKLNAGDTPPAGSTPETSNLAATAPHHPETLIMGGTAIVNPLTGEKYTMKNLENGRTEVLTTEDSDVIGLLFDRVTQRIKDEHLTEDQARQAYGEIAKRYGLNAPDDLSYVMPKKKE